jgi:ABC-type transport system involved in multi-copper enzyme maturation permease subunit
MTVVAPPPAPTRPRPTPPTRLRLFRAALRSEWTKLSTVRSTVWSLLVTVAIIVGLGALFCAARVSRWDRINNGPRSGFDPAGFSMNGIFLAQLAIGVLGVLIMSSEYATGQIRATLGAIPQRRLVLVAKSLVFGVVVLVVGFVACVTAFAIGQSILAAKNAGVSLGDPGVTRAVVGGALYLAAVGLLGLGLAAIVRRTAAAIATLVGLLLILPILASFLPDPWNTDVAKYLPGEAGGAIFHVVQRDTTFLAPWPGFAVLAAWTAAALILGAVLLDRRDA